LIVPLGRQWCIDVWLLSLVGRRDEIVRVVVYFCLLGSALWCVGCLARAHVSLWEGLWMVLCGGAPGGVVFVSGSVLGRWVDS
jgi:hypothetical protein